MPVKSTFDVNTAAHSDTFNLAGRHDIPSIVSASVPCESPDPASGASAYHHEAMAVLSEELEHARR